MASKKRKIGLAGLALGAGLLSATNVSAQEKQLFNYLGQPVNAQKESVEETETDNQIQLYNYLGQPANIGEAKAPEGIENEKNKLFNNELVDASEKMDEKPGFFQRAGNTLGSIFEEAQYGAGVNGRFSQGEETERHADFYIDWPFPGLERAARLGLYLDYAMNPEEKQSEKTEITRRERELIGPGIYNEEIRRITTEESSEYSHWNLGIQLRTPVIEYGNYETIMRVGVSDRETNVKQRGELTKRITDGEDNILGSGTANGETKVKDEKELVPTGSAQFGMRLYEGSNGSVWAYLGVNAKPNDAPEYDISLRGNF